MEQPVVERQRLGEQRVQVGRHDARRRHPRELRELVDQLLQRLDLADDGRGALLDQLARRRRRGAEVAAHPLGAQLNRGQRVLDLVREPARHVAPGRHPLRPDQRGHVVEHQDRPLEAAVLAEQRRGGGREVQLAPFARQRELLRAGRRAAPLRA